MTISRRVHLFVPAFALASLASASGGVIPPENVPATFAAGKNPTSFAVVYEGQALFKGRYEVAGQGAKAAVKIEVRTETGTRGEITQRITLQAPPGEVVSVRGVVTGSSEAFPAETYSPAQDRFKLVRNSVGLSSNLRNNAVYDRRRDWMLEGPGDGATHIRPARVGGNSVAFDWECTGPQVEFTFRPLFYQKHKNLPYYEPWNYDVWKGSVTGWCSWWAYFTDVHERDVEAVSKIFSEKLRDFGYRYIQIDDGYQSGSGGLPKDWLHTNDRFPSGLAHLAKTIRDEGLSPALWLNVHFGDAAFVESHPDWFIRDAAGKPYKGPWIDYGIDGSNPKPIDEIIRPTYRALHQMGWQYVKVDALRHLLYDDSYPNRAYFAAKGIKLEDAYRACLKAIREEIGQNTYMLACWGVLPEVIGIANGCRLGGDGFGPSTLQQYTSWNNVVWRNDPDHCDIKPKDASGHYVDGEERIRPVLVSMAGAQLLLSDKPEVYQNDANLEGVKRSSPILFTVPGQLYDYDPIKTDHLKKGLRNEHGGANSGPIDADQRGDVCPWWMLDINKPFESWTVLTRMNWESHEMEPQKVRFADLGLPDQGYSVFEFWNKQYLGDFHGEFPVGALPPKGVATYSIRKTLNRPQVLSTSRHISQGGLDLESVVWQNHELRGVSDVVRGDPYVVYVRIPDGFSLKSAQFNGYAVDISMVGKMATLRFIPLSTGKVRWTIRF